jgi:hypothetical protein
MAAETETNTSPGPAANPAAAPAPERVELPESATVEEAVGFLMQVEDEAEAPPPVNPNARPRKEGDEIDPPADALRDLEAEGDGEGEADAEAGEGEQEDEGEPQEQEPEAAVADAPEFWSDDDKKVLAALPKDAQAAVSATVRKYEQARIAFVNEKVRETAGKVKEAEGAAQQLHDMVAGNATWWQQVWPKLQTAYTDKWTSKLTEAGVQSWEELADRDPGLWAKYKQQRDNEAAMLVEANRRGQADIQRAREQQARADAQRIQAAKGEAHAEMLKKYPDAFKNPDEIYNNKLGPYMVAHGISVDRVNAISEAPILEIAYKAMLYDQAEAAKKAAKTQVSAVLDGKTKPGAQPHPNPAAATPTRVTPGAPVRVANRQGEAHRQVSERFRKSGSVGDAAALIEQLRL